MNIVKTIRASQTGAQLNSNVHTGGGTDDTAVLQSVLDTAKDGLGLHLIMDGAALIHGLLLYSNTTVECLNKDCGFYLADQTNGSLMRNAHLDFTEIQDRNIRLLGGTYNHNCRNQLHHAPTDIKVIAELDKSVLEGERLSMAFEFFGVENLTVQGITIEDQRTFGMLVANWKHVDMADIIINLPNRAHAQNQDGIHFWGPGQFLSMRNISGCAGDDFIALAPDEHDQQSSITDVLIDGVFLNEADQGIRLLSRASGRLDRVTIRNVTGRYRSFGFYINSWFPAETCGNFGSITFENIDLRPMEPNYDYRPPLLFQIGGRFERLAFINVQDHRAEHQRVLFELSSPFHTRRQDLSRTHIDEMVIDGLSVSQSDALAVPALQIDCEIDRLFLRDTTLTYQTAGQTPFIEVGANGRVGLLAVSNLIGSGLSTLVSVPHGEIKTAALWDVLLPDGRAVETGEKGALAQCHCHNVVEK